MAIIFKFTTNERTTAVYDGVTFSCAGVDVNGVIKTITNTVSPTQLISHEIMKTGARNIRAVDTVNGNTFVLSPSAILANVYQSAKFFIDIHAVSVEDTAQLVDHYAMYSRLPHDCVFLNVSDLGILCKKTGDDSFRIYTLAQRSDKESIEKAVFYTDITFKEGDIIAKSFPPINDIYNIKPVVDLFGSEEELIEAYLKQMVDRTILVLRALLFINTRNLKHQVVKPTRKELPPTVPKVMVPKCEFKVVTLYRSLDDVVNLTEFNTEVKKQRETANAPGKATLVRGHFKKRSSGLYWWSHHVRNYANKDTVGMVDKVYDVVVK